MHDARFDNSHHRILSVSQADIAKPVLANRALATITVIDNGWPAPAGALGIGARPARLRLSWASALTPRGHSTGPKRINREAVEYLLQTFVTGGYGNGIGIALLVL